MSVRRQYGQLTRSQAGQAVHRPGLGHPRTVTIPAISEGNPVPALLALKAEIERLINEVGGYINQTGRVHDLNFLDSAIRTGRDRKLVTGTSGTSGNLAEWDANGDAIDSGEATSKLTGIEAGADKTDATNVRAAGAVMEASGNLSNQTVPVSDASGDLQDGTMTDDGTDIGVGTGSPSVSGGASGVDIHGGAGDAELHLHNNTTGSTSTDGSNLTASGLDLYLTNRESGSTFFWVNGAERLSISSSGVVAIGAGPELHQGSGTPESAVSAPVGSLFLRTDGGASTTLYVKESGTGNTGWVAK